MGSYYAEAHGHSILYDANEANPSAEDGNFTGWTIGDEFILVVQVSEPACDKETAAQAFKVQFAKYGGGFADVTDVSEISWGTGTTLVDGATGTQRITTQATGCVGKSIDWVYENEGDNLTGSYVILDDSWGELQWALDTTNATAGSVYTFQVVNVTDSNTALTGTIASSITLAIAAQEYLQDVAGNMPAATGILTTKTSFHKALAGNMPNPTGELSTSFMVSLSLAGNMPNPTGGLVKKISKNLAGILGSISGTLTRKTSKNLQGISGDMAGVLDTGGQLTQNIYGDMPNPLGAIVKKISISLSGIIGAITGGIRKKIGKNLQGNLPPTSGDITKGISKTLNGDMPYPGGDLGTSYSTTQTIAGIMGEMIGSVVTLLNPIIGPVTKVSQIIIGKIKGIFVSDDINLM